MDVRQQLSSLLAQEFASLENLHQILVKENQALLDSDVSAIEQITSSKNQALDTQSGLTLQRQTFTRQHTGDNDHQSLQKLVSSLGRENDLETLLGRLQQLAEECQKINRDNGRLILQKQEHAQGALQVLRQTTDELTGLYSGQGKTEAKSRPRSLGKA